MSNQQMYQITMGAISVKQIRREVEGEVIGRFGIRRMGCRGNHDGSTYWVEDGPEPQYALDHLPSGRWIACPVRDEASLRAMAMDMNAVPGVELAAPDAGVIEVMRAIVRQYVEVMT